MIKFAKLILSSILFVFVVTSCDEGVIQTVAIPHLVPQTVEVTKVVMQTVIATQVVQHLTPQAQIQIISTPDEPQPGVDADYFDGIVVITQYYTYLGNGLYEKAYRLLSSSAQRPRSLSEYVQMTKLSFKDVEIISILPYYLSVKHQGGQTYPDMEGKKRFAVQIKAWGEGGMSGSALNGELQNFFIVLVIENGQWKIDSFATAPLR